MVFPLVMVLKGGASGELDAGNWRGGGCGGGVSLAKPVGEGRVRRLFHIYELAHRSF